MIEASTTPMKYTKELTSRDDANAKDAKLMGTRAAQDLFVLTTFFIRRV